MATKSSIQVRLDSKLKADAEAVLENIGLDTPTAIRIFYRKIVSTRSIPFSLEETPYRFTPEEEDEILAAEKESNDQENLVGPFDSSHELIEHLHAATEA
jgi:addiction module RelB/DinJ family antitoxin